jgi:hypothetical protein
MFLWKGTLLPNNNHLPFHPPPPPFLQAKDVILNGEYGMKRLFLVGYVYFITFSVSALGRLLVFLVNCAHYTTFFYYEKVR